MPEFNFAFIISSFIAGVFTFFAPCTLPLVPAFLGIISGAGPESLSNQSEISLVRRRIFFNAVFYVLGFSLIFITFGVAFSYIGTILFIREILENIGGLFVIAFGLFLLGLIKIPGLDSEKKIHVSRLFRNVSWLNSFLIGSLFALGWSPCVGPLLGSVLLLATSSGTVLQGTFLLIVFSFGLAIPFLLTAFFIGKAFRIFSKWDKIISAVNRVAGLFLVIIGFLMISGKFTLIHASFINYFYRFPMFEVFINRFL
jgi:cytochrome c-type biogenesis protein